MEAEAERELVVGIDVSPLRQTAGGTARHIECLTEALEATQSVHLRKYAFGGHGRVSAVARDLAWYLAGLPLRARAERVDLLHCPTFRAPLRSPVPLVVTFHDLAVLRHPYVFNSWTRSYSRHTLGRISKAAGAIIAVSDFTRAEVVDVLGVAEERVFVVPNGVGLPFAADGPAAGGDYVLAVSTLEPRKNLQRLVDGFQRARLPGCELRVVGPRGWGKVEVGGRGVRWLGEVRADTLASLYRGARCVAYVSLYEGFGLPVLEAMACGAAVVTSQAPALLEVGGGVPVAVDALDPEAIAAGLTQASDARAELGARGIERARGFAWEKVARATLDVYRSVLR
jgi:glycosyltransferase involved in cell wall biosynthesis